MKEDVKVYILSNNKEKIFGVGPYCLLKEIEQTGSLRKAAIQMNMAYTKALRLIKKAEVNFEQKLVETTTGGTGGGGAVLTGYAKDLLIKYERLNREISEFAEMKFRELFKEL